MIFGNRTIDDILLKKELQELEQNNPDNFDLFFTVDKAPPKSANWTQGVGFVTKEMIKEHLPPPSNETLILHCGPRVFNEMMVKHLTELGYT